MAAGAGTAQIAGGDQGYTPIGPDTIAPKKGKPAWMSEKDPVMALHHVVQHLTGSEGPGMTEKVKFDLGAALQPLLAPYQGQISAANAAGAASAGPGASQQMRQASAGAPNLAQYLGQISQGLGANPGLGVSDQGLAGVLQSGLAGVGKADQSMAGAIGQQAAGAGNAGLLTDLLNAAKYQAIYKQAAYGTPPSAQQDPALASLYKTVVAGGNALSGPGALPTSITGAKPTAGSAGGGINQGSSPFGL